MSSKMANMLDNTMGKAQKTHGQSLKTFLASATASAAVLGLGAVTYILLKLRFPEYYSQQSRCNSDMGWQPTRPLLQQLLFPHPDFRRKDAAGLDNYFFHRYLHTLTRVFLLLGLIVSPILIPMNAIHGRDEIGGVKGLDRLSFSNVSMLHTDKYWVHLAVAILIKIYICYTIHHELQEYTRIRSLSTVDISRSLLVSNSARPLSPTEIQRYLHKTAGGVRSISSTRNYSTLRTKIRRRAVLLKKLERAETTIIMRANFQKATRNQVHNRSDPLWMQYLREKDRPSFLLRKSPWLPFVGTCIDAVQHLRSGVAQFNKDIEYDQQHPEDFQRTNTTIVHFNRPVSMPLAAIALKAHIPPSWTLKHAAVSSDTIWTHISISWWQKCVRTCVVYLLITGLILGSTVPVTIAGSLSQIKTLANAVSWLKWIETLPEWLIAAIQGVVPPILLAGISASIPIVIRLITKSEGLHSRQVTENHVQIYYFAFLFIQGFLIISLSAGIATTVGELKSAFQALPVILGWNLPRASNYFFSYLIMVTVTTVVLTLVDAIRLFNLAVVSPLLDKTARQTWQRIEMMSLRRWGSLLPVITNIACISIVFSVIAPLILVFSGCYFTVIWLLYRAYPPKLVESDIGNGGFFYPTAMRQLLTGVYFMELCLAGLFFLVRDASDTPACITQGVIMAVAGVLTVLFHIHLYECFSWVPLPKFLRIDRSSSQHNYLPQETSESEMNMHSTDKTTGFVSAQIQDDALRPCRPVVWIPKDELGIASDEIYRKREPYESELSCKGTYLDSGGKIRVWGPPPDI